MMKTFPGLEGARGWLAWAVVVWHLVQTTGTDTVIGRTYILGMIAAWSVEVFIIMSGFVITHLILSKKERYPTYITRRALRLFPAFLVALAAGILSFPLWFETAASMEWLRPSRLELAQKLAAEYSDRFWTHVVAHISMLHGTIPNNILPQSQAMFLGPAWSASLEWQFYLIAPIVIWLTGRSWGIVTLISGTFVSVSLYNWGVFGDFMLPSVLTGAAHFFAFGIATRISWFVLPQLRAYPVAAVAMIAMTLFLSISFMPLVIWSALIAYTLVIDDAKASDRIQKSLSILLDSKIARAAGARSYSVYILHMPVLIVGAYVGRVALSLGYLGTAAVTTIFATVGVLIASEVTYRFIELPAINLGKKIGKRRSLATTSDDAPTHDDGVRVSQG